MLKFSQRDIDVSYTKYQLNDLLDDYNISSNLKDFMGLFRILNEESLTSEVRSLLQSAYVSLGEKIKIEIIESMEKWLNTHTSGKHLLEWDSYNDDPEATWAWSLVNDGELDSHSGFHYDLKPSATKKLIQLATEFYGKLSKEDREGFKSSQDELSFNYNVDSWKEYLPEAFREFIARKYTDTAFKAWKEHWGESLYKPTHDVKEAIKRLKNAQIKDLASAISLALNVYHVHGKMYEHTNLSEEDLDYLDNMPDSDVDKLKRKIFGDAYAEMSLTSKLKFSKRG